VPPVRRTDVDLFGTHPGVGPDAMNFGLHPGDVRFDHQLKVAAQDALVDVHVLMGEIQPRQQVIREQLSWYARSRGTT
jgi:hypothetical protein